MVQHIVLIMFLATLGACTREAGEDIARSICGGSGNCSYRCPDGTVTDAGFPRCPVNERDLLPPSNDNVGPPK
ncbi:hypothetical protein [Emcibacter sp.]|uniref:hypothetical protein n=1 Tax=Emcibacter sp. TaxID=1979954 RepID=UPI002AA67784|nr:hypothetical protein [Emcibacter sp.]